LTNKQQTFIINLIINLIQYIMNMKKLLAPNLYFTWALLLALISGYLGWPFLLSSAEVVSQIFIRLLKLVSLPIIFLSIVSTISGMESLNEIKNLGKRVIKYTLMTTIAAATIALSLFVLINPVRAVLSSEASTQQTTQGSYLTYLIEAIPSNIVQPFNDNNVLGVLFLALLLSLSVLALPASNRSTLHTFFSSLYAAVMKMTSWLVRLMPLAIWSFVTLFFQELKNGLEYESLALYLACVVGANLIQAIVVLPILLKWNGINPWKTAKGMFPALSVAFFTKSSAAALPMAMRCAEENVGVSRKVASFTLPLCTTINMNGCAAFILTTVLFVSMSNGMVFAPFEMILWIFIATLAAVGNAGVPMGCYFLASAFLAAMNVPLHLLGIILPFYAMIDMLESAINVWSDSCVTAIVHQQTKASDVLPNLAPIDSIPLDLRNS
jgi:Na+/H+-dicarboxylate symporter